MGIRVGIPVLKLSRGAQATKRKGDARKVVLEGLSERYSKDQDLDRSRSSLNVYTGFTRGKDLYKYWEQEANGHLDAKGRKLRADAVVGYSLIIKPDMESMQGMTEEEGLKFLDDSMSVISDLLQEHGLTVDATALHRDELNDHIHMFGHDPEYKAGKKIDIRLFGDFNREYPKRMRALGYDVEDLTVYDTEKTKGMSEDEKADYKSEMLRRKQEKKKAGRSSNQYKADRLDEQEKALQAREDALRASVEAFERSKAEYSLTIEKERTEAKRALDDEMKRERMKMRLEADADIKSYKVQKQSKVDTEIEAEKAKKLNGLKSAIGTAYAAQMDYESATRSYKAIVTGLADRIIENMNQRMIKSGGKSVPVGNFYADFVRKAVESASAIDSETVYTEHTAKQNMDRLAMTEAQFGVLNDKMNQKSGDDYGYSK